MASSKLKAEAPSLKCLIRNRPVAATPEELVRQSAVHQMIFRLSFPKSLIAVEKDLAALLDPLNRVFLKRRLDVVAFTKDASDGSLKPLLIIECKAAAFDEKALNQLLGYNHFLSAPYFAIVSASKTALFRREGNRWALFHDALLPYPVLMKN